MACVVVQYRARTSQPAVYQAHTAPRINELTINSQHVLKGTERPADVFSWTPASIQELERV